MSDHQCTCGHPLGHHAHGHRCLRNVSAYRSCPCEHFEIDQAEAVPECPNCGHVHGGRAPSGRCYHLGSYDAVGQREACRCTSTEPSDDDDEPDWGLYDDQGNRLVAAGEPSTGSWGDRQALAGLDTHAEEPHPPWDASAAVMDAYWRRQDERARRSALALGRRAAVLRPMLRHRPEYPEPHFDWPELGEIAAILGIDIVKAGDHQ